MPALLALPETGSGPAVLIICDMHGRNPFFENLAGRLADLGYVALCPAPFHRMGPIDARDPEGVARRRAAANELEMLADLETALTWLRARPEVTPGRMAVIGFSMGGTFALVLAARRDDLATCCFYGFPAGSREPAVAAPAPLEVVDDISGPLIGFWGEEDTTVGIDNVRQLIDTLAEREVVFYSVTYPGVGHDFMATEPADERTRDAAGHAWARMTAFLRRHVGSD